MEPQELATKCLSYIKNVDGTAPNEHRYTQTEDAPDWFGELVREAHFGLLPDDWSYRFVQDALMLCENCDTEEGPQVDIDSEYPYTHDRLDWFASHLERNAYCDEFVEEFGFRHTGQYGGDTLALVAGGMYKELEAISRLVWAELVKQCEQQEEAAEVE